MESIKKIMKKDSENTKESELSSIKKCSVCDDPLGVEVIIFEKKIIGPIACSCMKAESKEIKDRLDREDEQRRISEILRFSMLDDGFRTKNFENFKIDESNNALYNVAKNYSSEWPEYKKSGKGFILYGPPGIGKTFATACIANHLIDEGVGVLPMRMDEIVNRIYSSYGNYGDYSESEILKQINNASLLIIDDIGTEHASKGEKEKQIIYSIIDTRYRSGKPMICTTNLDMKQLKDKLTQSDGVSRTYDRIVSMCTPIHVKGVSRRISDARDTQKDFINKLTRSVTNE